MRPIVVAVDDDRRVLDSLAMLMESAGYTPQSFTSAEEFLQSPALATAACVIADERTTAFFDELFDCVALLIAISEALSEK